MSCYAAVINMHVKVNAYVFINVYNNCGQATQYKEITIKKTIERQTENESSSKNNSKWVRKRKRTDEIK